MSYYTYIIRCADGSLYTGITTNPARRLREHKVGLSGKGARYTAAHEALGYECVFSCPDRSSASRLEWKIKSLKRPEKLRLISGENVLGEGDWQRCPLPED